MRKACCFVFSFFLFLAAGAQRSYFIYFQTENSSPFYLKMGERVLSATASGYLILPELSDSIYNITIGFPSVLVESRFRIPVAGNDRGLIIQSPGPSPTLSDLQTGNRISPFVDESTKNISYQERTDDFTTLLSKAANDPTIMFVAVRQAPKKEEPAPAPETAVRRDTIDSAPVITLADPKKDSVEKNSTVLSKVVDPPSITPPVADTTTTVVLPHRLDTVALEPPVKMEKTTPSDTTSAATQLNEEPYHRSVVKKHAESSTAEGFGLVYYDIASSGTDTIRLLIPNPRIVFRQRDTTENDGQMLDLKKEMAQAPKKEDTTATANTSTANPNACKAIATESDFFRLRKAMAAKVSDEDMVAEAKKSFRSRCFSTEQVKNLGSLFLTSAGKYLFFDAAYLHVSDPGQFPSLSSEIRDDYYLKRFKALIGQ